MVDGRTTDGRRTDGRTTEHGYTISSPCEPDGSGELIILLLIAFSLADLAKRLPLTTFKVWLT